jgi:hypothetical protein
MSGHDKTATAHIARMLDDDSTGKAIALLGLGRTYGRLPAHYACCHLERST